MNDRTIYHESGHAAIAHLFGWEYSVNLIHSDLACTVVKNENYPKADVVTFLLAGRMAELIKLGTCEASFNDVANALRLANWDQDFVTCQQGRARELLEANWPMVEQIAAGLLRELSRSIPPSPETQAPGQR